MHPSYKMTLADGFSLQIRAGDAEAAPAVELLAKAMRLEPGCTENVLRVVTGETEALYSVEAGEVICRLLKPNTREDAAAQALQISLVIAHMAQKRGGILVHGGLAEFEGQGVILAAPGNTGKTTAVSRLPAPWKPLSDDAALIVRGSGNRYHSHPWPTWSRFFFGGSGGSWDTGYGVPLRRMCFLARSSQDSLEDLPHGQAAAMLIESVEQANAVFNRRQPPAVVHENHLEQLAVVCAITDTIPAYRLVLSLTGNFWTRLEALSGMPATETPRSGHRSVQAGPFDPFRTGGSGVIVSGKSMFPTLAEPGYADVRPYGDRKLCRGDVIHFQSPATGTMVIHRVMEVRPEGLVTRGDSNARNDPGFVPLSAVEGRVVRVKDIKGNRPVRGGRAGMMDYVFARLFRRARIIAGRIDRRLSLSRFLAGGVRRIYPKREDWKIVFFGHPLRGHLKIMAEGTCVGYYDRGVWNIFYPWRFRVNPARINAVAKWVESERERWGLIN
jgi:SynChlorMet cassette protein ScmC